jgi:hypothetical protein
MLRTLVAADSPVDNKIFERSGFIAFLVVVHHLLHVGPLLRLDQDIRMVPDPAKVLNVVEKSSSASA